MLIAVPYLTSEILAHKEDDAWNGGKNVFQHQEIDLFYPHVS